MTSFCVELSGHVIALLLVPPPTPPSSPWPAAETYSLRLCFFHHLPRILWFSLFVFLHFFCRLNNKKSGKSTKNEACTNLLLRYLLTFLISYIKLQDLLDKKFKTLWCTVFNIGLFCCMCCIIFKNRTKLGPLLQVAKLSVYNLSNKQVFYTGMVCVVFARGNRI